MTRRGWGVGRLTLALYPFGAGAAGVNVFFASLIGSWMGGTALSPAASLLWGMIIGAPAAWAFARHIRGLMDAADRPPASPD